MSHLPEAAAKAPAVPFVRPWPVIWRRRAAARDSAAVVGEYDVNDDCLCPGAPCFMCLRAQWFIYTVQTPRVARRREYQGFGVQQVPMRARARGARTSLPRPGARTSRFAWTLQGWHRQRPLHP